MKDILDNQRELVSIIIPVYNTEKYISRCITSVLNQTYKNIEIILVDDGSSDNSYKICCEFCKDNCNIHLIHQNNKGVSSARNIGIHYAKGKYIFFIDSDDYILDNFIMNYMQIGDYDYISGGYQENNKQGWKCKYDNIYLTIDEYKEEYYEYLGKVPTTHVIHSRYKSNIIKANNIRFDEKVCIGEDSRFNFNYFKHISNIAAIDNTEYIYTIRSNSAVNSFWIDRLDKEREECQIKEQFFGSSFRFSQIKYIHWYIAMDHYYFHKKNDKNNSEQANKMLHKAMKDEYFRSCKEYIMKFGTKDCKICLFCTKLGSYALYVYIVKFIKIIKSIINNLINDK